MSCRGLRGTQQMTASKPACSETPTSPINIGCQSWLITPQCMLVMSSHHWGTLWQSQMGLFQILGGKKWNDIPNRANAVNIKNTITNKSKRIIPICIPATSTVMSDTKWEVGFCYKFWSWDTKMTNRCAWSPMKCSAALPLFQVR